MTTVSDEDIRDLRRLEESLWREESRFDVEHMDKVLAPDFFEIGRSGRIYQRDEIVSSPRHPIDAVIPLLSFKVRPLTADIMQVTYNSQVAYDGVVEYGRRSSIWSRTASGWQLRFHQGTPYNVAS